MRNTTLLGSINPDVSSFVGSVYPCCNVDLPFAPPQSVGKAAISEHPRFSVGEGRESLAASPPSLGQESIIRDVARCSFSLVARREQVEIIQSSGGSWHWGRFLDNNRWDRRDLSLCFAFEQPRWRTPVVRERAGGGGALIQWKPALFPYLFAIVPPWLILFLMIRMWVCLTRRFTLQCVAFHMQTGRWALHPHFATTKGTISIFFLLGLQYCIPIKKKQKKNTGLHWWHIINWWWWKVNKLFFSFFFFSSPKTRIFH